MAALKVLLLKTSRRDFNQLMHLMNHLEASFSSRERFMLLAAKLGNALP